MRALVVDDSRPVRGILAKIMRSLGFETSEAANGKEALNVLERDSRYDVVTVNWQMPVMDGLEFASAVRQDHRFRHLPLLMISTESDARQVQIAMKAGVSQYLVKPCTVETVRAKLCAMGLIEKSSVGGPPGKPRSMMGPAVASEDTAEPMRVLLVDDSSIVRRVITKTLHEAGDMQVIGAAKDGIEGLELVESSAPDVVLLDVDMPRMDGLEMLRELKRRRIAVPVVMFSSRTERGAKIATDALLLGAKDFVFKPGGAGMSDLQAGQRAIVQQIIPRLRVMRRRRVDVKTSRARPTTRPTPQRIDLVVVGASTGGPAALASLLSDHEFRTRLHVPIVIAQHMPKYFTQHLADRLAEDSGLDVGQLGGGESLRPGMIRIAPGSRHACVCLQHGDLVTTVNDDPPVNSCRPSVDVLFRSAAKAAGPHVLAVVLTGMGHDGREGCRCVRDAGGWVVAQDESSSVVWGMPGSVVEAGLADDVVPMHKMGAYIAQKLNFGRNATSR